MWVNAVQHGHRKGDASRANRHLRLPQLEELFSLGQRLQLPRECSLRRLVVPHVMAHLMRRGVDTPISPVKGRLTRFRMAQHISQHPVEVVEHTKSLTQRAGSVCVPPLCLK